MSVRKGFKVWVEVADGSWAAAEVAEDGGKVVRALTESGKLVSVAVGKLHPRDTDEEHGGVDDMTKLTYLNEPGVLFNLARRYAHNEIYTYTGSILIAVNPFTKLPHLYNIHMMEQYKGAQFGELSPHVFAVADAAYRAMMNDFRSQSILVSGESGAGKTETTKLIMQYLTHVGGRAVVDDRSVEQQVLESNPLLEAFGNARTVRNDNSSRFGKFVEIQFDINGRISGAAIRTYLLERSRVVQITDPERNYHCFYQLCASGMDAEKYKLGHPSNFHYLNQSKTYELTGVSNAEEYLKTRRAMDIVGICPDEQDAIFRTLAGILHLGNIDFSPGKEHDSSCIKDPQSAFHLRMVSDLFMCDAKLLLTTLCSRSIQTLEGCIVKTLDCAAAIANRDTFAKTIYARLFDWLVEKINKSVGQDCNSKIQIGVLDIYGFECFRNNSFEQFCINFANEKLQQHFNEHVFKMEQEEYKREEINWSYIEFIDNQDVLDLIEKKPIGIIALLDEACMFPKSTHETFSTKLFWNLGSHSRLEKTKFSETDFTISHYAGKVTYQTNSFLEKNRDYVVLEHCNLLSSSKCTFVASLFPPQESSKSNYKFSSVATRFKHQLQALMETLKSTEPHYIRCVKPNSMNQPQQFEDKSVLHQLRCGGVLEAVRISLAGYPTRKMYSEFIDRYGLLAPEFTMESYDEKGMTLKILEKLSLHNFQLGKNKVFLRAGQIAVLDSKRAEVLDNAAKLIQAHFRCFIAHRDFIALKRAAINLQCCFRGFFARVAYESKKKEAAALFIQRYARRRIQQQNYLQLYSAAVLMQSVIRGLAVRQNLLLKKQHRAALRIQAQWRMWKAHLYLRLYRCRVVALQCAWRRKLARRELRRLKLEANETGALRAAKNKLEKQLEDLTWRLHLEKRLRASNEEAKQIELSKLHKEIELLNVELNAAKGATRKAYDEISTLHRQLETSNKEKESFDNNLSGLLELNKENSLLKSSIESLAREKLEMEHEILQARKERDHKIARLQDVEVKYSQLQQDMNSMEEKLSNLERENHVLRQSAISLSPRLGVYTKTLSENLSNALTLPGSDKKLHAFSPTPSKHLIPYSHGLSETRRSKLTAERHQDYHGLLIKCIKDNLGFKDGKPVAACIIYKCLLHWHAFEAERTTIFDYIIEGINSVLMAGDENDVLPYWLSNTSALLCLLQRNLRIDGFLATPRRSPGSIGFTARMAQGLKYPFKVIGFEETHVDARYPAILFKQQLTASLEKIFGFIRDNLKKEISPLLSLCIQAPKSARVPAGKTSRSPGGGSQQILSSHWDRIIKFLDALLTRLRDNYVPSFFIRKLITQVFSFINIQLFNSLLLRRECCTFSNGEYVKSGLAELERWITNATEEFAGTSWHELSYIRQAVGFLVIHQKRKKSLDEISQELCPALTVRQIYRICTMYWDDKYSTQSVSSEVVSNMRDILSKDSQNFMSNSFLLDDDLSIPFSTEDISKAIPPMDPTDVDLPLSLHDIASAQFLISNSDEKLLVPKVEAT